MAVADGIAVNDLSLSHILTNLLGLLLINPLGERPVLTGNLSIVSLSRNKRRSNLLESGIERLIVQENPIIVVSSVEAILDLADRLGNLPDIAISGKSDKGSVHTGTRRSSQQIIPTRIVGSQSEGIIFGIAGRRFRDGLLALASTWGRLLSRNLTGTSWLKVSGERDGIVARVRDEVKDEEGLL